MVQHSGLPVHGAGRVRGVAEIVGAVLVSLIALLAVAIALGFFASYAHPVTAGAEIADATLCGNVLTVYVAKTSPEPLRIEKIVGVYFVDGQEVVEENPVSVTVSPGDSRDITLQHLYNYVYIVGNAALPPVKNSCM